MLCGGGWWVPAQAALKGGKGWRGVSGTQHLSPVLGGQVIRYYHGLTSWSGWLDPGTPCWCGRALDLLACPIYIFVTFDEALFQSSHRPFRCGRHIPSKLIFCSRQGFFQGLSRPTSFHFKCLWEEDLISRKVSKCQNLQFGCIPSIILTIYFKNDCQVTACKQFLSLSFKIHLSLSNYFQTINFSQ